MKKALAPARNFLKPLLRQLDADVAQSQWRDYQNLLYACLPAAWRSRVLLGKLEGLRWQLWVANGSDGSRLRFLLSEIKNELARKLPHPPELSVAVRPDIWAQQRRPAAIHLHRRHYYTAEEADAVIQTFIDALR